MPQTVEVNFVTNSCRFLLQLETKPTSTPAVDVGAPSVDLLNSYVAPAAVPSSIGVRKIQPKKGAVSRNAMQEADYKVIIIFLLILSWAHAK